MAYKEHKVLCEQLRSLNFHRKVSVNNFNKPNFELVSEILNWATSLTEAGSSENLPKEIDTEAQRVLLIRSYAKYFFQHLNVRLNTKHLYAAQNQAVPELLKITGPLYKAHQKAQGSFDQLRQDDDQEIDSSTASDSFAKVKNSIDMKIGKKSSTNNRSGEVKLNRSSQSDSKGETVEKGNGDYKNEKYEDEYLKIEEDEELDESYVEEEGLEEEIEEEEEEEVGVAEEEDSELDDEQSEADEDEMEVEDETEGEEGDNSVNATKGKEDKSLEENEEVEESFNTDEDVEEESELEDELSDEDEMEVEDESDEYEEVDNSIDDKKRTKTENLEETGEIEESFNTDEDETDSNDESNDDEMVEEEEEENEGEDGCDVLGISIVKHIKDILNQGDRTILSKENAQNEKDANKDNITNTKSDEIDNCINTQENKSEEDEESNSKCKDKEKNVKEDRYTTDSEDEASQTESLLKELSFLNESCAKQSSYRTPRKTRKQFNDSLNASINSIFSPLENLLQSKKKESTQKKKRKEVSPSPNKNQKGIKRLKFNGDENKDTGDDLIMDEDSQDGKLTIADILTPSPRKRNSKVSPDKNSKQKKNSESEELPQEVIELLQSGIDDMLEEKAQKTHLTAIHVKNIIKTVMTDKNVLSMVRNTVYGSQEETFMPKLTRAKMKELCNQELGPINMWAGVPNASPGNLENFVSTDFPDEDEDEEYNPDKDSQVASDDESFLSARGSEFSSCQNTPTTPSTPKSSIYNPTTPHSNSTTQGTPRLHRIQMLRTGSAKKKASVQRSLDFEKMVEDGALISNRTRSKQSFIDTPLETLEMAFKPPDITAGMYETECEDEEWTNFLNDYIQPLNTLDGQEDEEADPEYIYFDEDKLDDEAIENAAEEFRHDRASRISKKEYNNMINDLLDSFDPGSDDESPSKPSQFLHPNDIPKFPVPPKICQRKSGQDESDAPEDAIWVEVMTPQFSPAQLEVLRCQMNQHVQLLCTSAIMCYDQPALSNISEHCTNYLNELQSSSQFSTASYYNSYYNTPNLSAAISTIEAMQKINKDQVDKILPKEKKTDKKSKAKGKTETVKKLQIPSEIVNVILSSKVFLYPQYLPVRMFQDPTEKKTNKTNKFLLSEDILLAAGLHLYLENDESNRLKKYKTMRDALANISNNVLVTKSLTQLQTRIKNLRSRNDSNNPVIQYFKNGSFELPPATYDPLPQFAGCPVSQFNLNLLDEAWKEELNERKVLASQAQPFNNGLSLNNNIVIIRGADGSMQVILPPSSNTTVISPQKGSIPVDLAHAPCAPISAITRNNSTIQPHQQEVVPKALPTSLSSTDVFDNPSAISSQSCAIPISLPPCVPESGIPPFIPTQNGALISIPSCVPTSTDASEIPSQPGTVPIYVPPYAPAFIDTSIIPPPQNCAAMPMYVPPSAAPIPTTVQGNVVDNGTTQGITNEESLGENYTTELEQDTNVDELTINSSFESFLKSPLSKKNSCRIRQKSLDLNVEIDKDKTNKADESNIEYLNTSEMETNNDKFQTGNTPTNQKLLVSGVTPDRSHIGANVGKTPRRDKISLESTSSEGTNERDIPISPSSSMDINASPLRSIFDTPISKRTSLVPYPVSPSPESRSSFYGIVPPNITTPTPKCPSSVKVLGLSNLNLSPVGGETPVLSDYFNIAPSSPGSTLNTPEKLQVKMRGRGIAALLTSPGKSLVPVTSVTITAYPVFTNITGGGGPPKDNGRGNRSHGDGNRGVDSGIENSYPPSPADHDESDGPESAAESQSSSIVSTGSDLQTSPIQASGSGRIPSGNGTFVTSVYDGPILTNPPIVNQQLGMSDNTISISLHQNPSTHRPIAAKPWSPLKGSPRKSSPLKQVSPIIRKYRKMSPHKKLSPTFRKLQPVLPKTSPLKHKRRLLAPKPTLSMTLSTSQIGSLSKQSSNILNVSENLLNSEKETVFSSNESRVSHLNENINVSCSSSQERQRRVRGELRSREEPDDFEEDSMGEDEDDDDDDESAQQQEEHLAALLKASSTITDRVRGNYSSERKGDHTGPGERRLNKQQRRLQARITALSTTIDNFTQSKVYAQSYMARVRELLLDKDPAIFKEFLSILNKFNSNDSSPVDLYKRLCDLLLDFPYLAEEFIAFLQPHQAIEIGKYDKYCTIHRMMDFLEKLELQFNSEPVHFQKIVRVLQNLSVSREELTLEEVKTSMAAVLRYPHLVEAFTQCFPQEPPPPSLQTDFEEIDLDAPGSPDSGENITLPEYELPCTPNSPERCSCSCHTSPTSTALSHISSAPQAQQHCQSCAIRFSEGRVFLQCGKTLRPAKVIYHVQKKEEKDESVEVGTDGKGKKGGLGDSLGQKKEVSTSCGTDKKHCTKIKVDDLIGRKDSSQLKDDKVGNNPKNVTFQESELTPNLTSKQVIFCSPPKEIHNENASIGICSSNKGAKTFTGVLDFEKKCDLSENIQADSKSGLPDGASEKAIKTPEAILTLENTISTSSVASSSSVSNTLACKKWTVDEDRVLLTTVQEKGNPTEIVFHEISKKLQTRSPKEVMDRFNYLISLMCEQNEASDDSASTCSEDSML